MVVFEYRQIELDYCPGCFGVWFDEGEVELLLETAGPASGDAVLKLIVVTRDATETKRRCPVCDKPMDKASVPGGKVILDRCPHGNGIWFDAGEFAAAFAESAGETAGQDGTIRVITDFLGEALDKRHEET
ncbi:zf-TFIIB domain-containing protein [bacterium]|nr:zf-TFIIB domain-containing protein [candidate division CSSED10-310 bacterium]